MRKGEDRRMLDELSDMSTDLSDWEMSFVESLTEQLDNGRELSSRQLDKLTEVYEHRVLGY